MHHLSKGRIISRAGVWFGTGPSCFAQSDKSIYSPLQGDSSCVCLCASCGVSLDSILMGCLGQEGLPVWIMGQKKNIKYLQLWLWSYTEAGSAFRSKFTQTTVSEAGRRACKLGQPAVAAASAALWRQCCVFWTDQGATPCLCLLAATSSPVLHELCPVSTGNTSHWE